jgi:hypothetical protein
MCNCDTTDLTIELILADPLVRLAMERDGISDQEMTAVLARAQAAVLRHQEEAA